MMARVEICHGDLGRSYKILGPVKARVTSGMFAWLRRERTLDDVDMRLSEVALKRGANAVINVTYKRGISFWSWRALTATGTAVFAEPQATYAPPAGWYPDPVNGDGHRWWDGGRWKPWPTDMTERTI